MLSTGNFYVVAEMLSTTYKMQLYKKKESIVFYLQMNPSSGKESACVCLKAKLNNRNGL